MVGPGRLAVWLAILLSFSGCRDNSVAPNRRDTSFVLEARQTLLDDPERTVVRYDVLRVGPEGGVTALVSHRKGEQQESRLLTALSRDGTLLLHEVEEDGYGEAASYPGGLVLVDVATGATRTIDPAGVPSFGWFSDDVVTVRQDDFGVAGRSLLVETVSLDGRRRVVTKALLSERRLVTFLYADETKIYLLDESYRDEAYDSRVWRCDVATGRSKAVRISDPDLAGLCASDLDASTIVNGLVPVTVGHSPTSGLAVKAFSVKDAASVVTYPRMQGAAVIDQTGSRCLQRTDRAGLLGDAGPVAVIGELSADSSGTIDLVRTSWAAKDTTDSAPAVAGYVGASGDFVYWVTKGEELSVRRFHRASGTSTELLRLPRLDASIPVPSIIDFKVDMRILGATSGE